MKIQLTTKIDESVVPLLQANQLPVDGVEAGAYLPLPQIEAYQKRLPDERFFFHAGRMGLLPGTEDALKGYLDLCPETPWISLHIDMIPFFILMMARYLRIYLPMRPPEDLTAKLIKRIIYLKSLFDRPIILENMPALPKKSFAFESEPERIRQVVEETDCGMLLDIAHARVASIVHDIDIFDYLSALPLERVRQIHVSSPRPLRDGFLYDAHESLEAQDYELLDWTLQRTQPEMVTLEYWRDAEQVQEHLINLDARCKLIG
jgi:hypothetical protein